jgi:hypothetical protein
MLQNHFNFPGVAPPLTPAYGIKVCVPTAKVFKKLKCGRALSFANLYAVGQGDYGGRSPLCHWAIT